MAPQLQINQGPQDALLFDNTKSYFGPVGYSRTSNFQMELRDVDAQNAPSLGGTVNFVIPKAADLLGPVDLMIEFDKAGAKAPDGTVVGWVESVGLAMIEKITFSVGSHDVETLTGEHLNIMNELMRSDKTRLGFNHTLKTGRPLVRTTLAAGTSGGVGTEAFNIDESTDASVYDRIIATEDHIKDGKKLIVPLGLFFTTHPSKYFPLAAVAGCNDVRISIKFRTQSELVMCYGKNIIHTTGKFNPTGAATTANLGALKFALGNGAFAGNRGCYLRCHYVHVTGPEATALMNREHVRLMKLWNGNEVSKQFQVKCTPDGSITTPLDIDLSFLHPVQELVITIRKVSDMGSETANAVAIGTGTTTNESNTAQCKNYFAYHGGGKDPNPDSMVNRTSAPVALTGVAKSTYLKSKTFQLKLNGQSRHLDGAGIDREYLVNRLMPMLHSNTSEEFSQLANSVAVDGVHNHDLHALAQIKDRKEIYVYPFALNPEGHNPSGSVNFSKVSHAKLSIGVAGIAPSAATNGSTLDDYQVDVYGVYYNWLAIKDGRALTSFA